MPEVLIAGPVGRIEARYHQGKNRNAPIAIVLHPHPEHGGTMNNKITYALFRSFVDQGFNTLRFNFRGVGRSEGKFDHGEGELSDAAACLDWLQVQNPEPSQCWVAGFSFGAWICMQLLMRRPELDGFIAVAPPANMYDFSFLAPCPVSGMILQGGKDDIVPKDSVLKLATKLSAQRGLHIDYRIIPEADHFFVNELPQLTNHVQDYVRAALNPMAKVVNG
ncbi:MAG: alpha/beta hydrolase [Alphaproteobacteria bacterium]|jgi:alpha/beta superfamily hydrolase|nr:alpha/beta hydrolase [Alphaproteobacteria bacterium]MBP9776412.1 alpha/beta hydrolase [Alphaproteobacteria bacterium]